MAYKTRSRSNKPDLRAPVDGNGQKLEPGRQHDVVLSRVIFLDEKILVVLEDSFGDTHLERLFIHRPNSTDYNITFMEFLTAFAKNPQELRTVHEQLLEGNTAVLEAFTGRAAVLTTKYYNDYINIDRLEMSHDSRDDWKQFQLAEVNDAYQAVGKDPIRTVGSAVLPPAAQSFWEPGTSS